MEKITDKLLNWASVLDERTKEQALRTSAMPFVYPHLALMPDAHLGKGATVGSVIPTLRAVMPAAVGVDIGCGMIAVRTQFTVADVVSVGPLAALREAIEKAVPLSAGGRNQKVTETAAKRIAELEAVADVEPERHLPHWREQLGSLGSGNHFIEVTRDEAGVRGGYCHDRLQEDSMTLAGKVAIVTGGNSGIGKSIVLALAEHGASIVIDYVCDEQATEDLEKQVAALGERAIGVEADVSKVEDLQRLVDTAVKHLSAAWTSWSTTRASRRVPRCWTLLRRSTRKCMDINLKSAFFGTQIAAKQMIAQGGGGRIINMTSVHEDWPMPGNTAVLPVQGRRCGC